jgi:putative ABC transport system permease protein
MPTQHPGDSLPRLARIVLRALLPRGERAEVLADIAAELVARERADGRAAARSWLWRQVLGSLPSLVRRTWWRGWTGFDPRANRTKPGGPAMESWIMDARYVARRLINRPTYAVLAVLTLALGAGGTAAIYSIVRALLLDPLPYANESEVGVLWQPGGWTEQEFLHIRPNVRAFRSLAGYATHDFTLRTGEGPLRLVPTTVASAELFDVLGARPLLGRTFSPGDDRIGSEPVAVLSYAQWQALGGDPGVLGRRLTIADAPVTVVGVMPPQFWFPDPTVRVWRATALDPTSTIGNLTLIGRVAAGQQVDRMTPALKEIAGLLKPRFSYPREWDKTLNPSVTPLRTYITGPIQPAVIATFVAMAVILVIACVNVAALMLGQVDSRATELAVRAALGGSRQRLTQQVIIEALVIGLISGAIGAGVAAAGFRLLVAALPLGTLAGTAALSWTVFWAAIAIAFGAALLVALVPVVSLWRDDLQSALGRSRTAGTGTRGTGGRVEGGIVVTQVALAVILAVGAGLLIRSVGHMRAIDPGVDARRVAVLDVTLPAVGGHAARLRLLNGVLPALLRVTGVRDVGSTQKLPLRGRGWSFGMVVEGRPDLAASTTYLRVVTPGYFEALGIRVREGRAFEETDRANTERLVVINEALARQYFPDGDAIGRRIGCGGPGWARVIGIVNNVAEARLTEPFAPARYCLYDQSPFVPTEASLVIRSDSVHEPTAVLERVRQTVERIAPEIAVQRATTMDLILTDAIGPARQLTILLALSTVLALVLGAVGIYGVVSHFVTRRGRDWSIRIALGLAPSQVIAFVVGRCGMLVAAGSVLGVLGALMLARALTSFLYGVRATDPPAIAGAVIALLGVGLGAAFVPALRASRSDPAEVLREQ